MIEHDSHRRYLIAVGIRKDLPKTGSRIVDSVNRMTRIFTGVFGYERVTQLDIDPTTDQIEKEIREFCLNRIPDDIVTLYYTGHADDVDGTHRVWTGSTLDRFTGNLETRNLARLMLRDTPLRCALIILDTCFAGQGGAEALLASMQSMSEGKTLAVLTAAYPREQIAAGDFAQLFEHAVRQPSAAGHEAPYVDLGTITRLIDIDPSRPGWQTVSHGVLGAKSETDLLPLFPNGRFNVQLHGLDLLTQLRIEQQELRASDLRGHFLPRARGVDIPAEPGWRFVGREAALRDLVSWLANSGDRSARVVTGGPGSGKSAVIARLVVLSDPGWRRTVPMEDLAADTIPPRGSIATGIHARGLTSAQVLAAICAAVGVRADTPADLLREMRGQPLTVAIDAIDEALDPLGLVAGVLRPLVEAGPAEGLRLLLGTRPHLLDSLGMADLAINLDDERYADPASIFQYVLRGLEADNPQSPYHAVPEDLVGAVASAVAEAAGHSFLVALIVSRTLLSGSQVPDPADPAWRDSLPATAADAMRKDLETRLGAEADRARDLLRPLAFAAGGGLPWEDLWAPLSSRISGRDYADEDLIWLREQAGSYVVEAMESGHSVYRLYHAALAEYLRQGCVEDHIHALFAAFLIGRVPASRAGPDWSRAHPYVLAHLATHAQRAGMLDSLLLDPAYLVNAVPAGLLAALQAARDPDAKLAARAYNRAVHQLRDQPEDHRFSYLELASRITHAARLTGLVADRAPHRRWSVPWIHWPPEQPHRILDGHLGVVNGVICTNTGDGNAVVASIGRDAKLRIWDAVTAEPRGRYAVGGAPLVAVQAARLPGRRKVLVMLAADGMLHTWDMPTAALARTVSVASFWRRVSRLRYANLTLRCLGTADGQQFAVAGGRSMRTTIWDLSSGHRMAVLPPAVAPGEIEFTELIDGRAVIVASLGGSEYWVADLQTGQELPHQRRRIPFARLRSIYDSVIRGSSTAYYALRDGPPVVAVRFDRNTATVWDLASGYLLGRWRREGSHVQVQLTDGRAVTITLPPRRGELSSPPAPTEDVDNLVPLAAVARNPGQSDRESRESLSLRSEIIGRFLRVEFHDQLEEPDRGAVTLTLAGHTADVTGYDWARLPDGHVNVVTASLDGTVRKWDLTSIGPERQEGTGQARVALHRVVGAQLEDGSSLGVTLADDGDVALWDLRTGKLAGDLEDHVEPCAIGVARLEGRRPVIVAFDTYQTMWIWNLQDGRRAAEFPADRIRWPSDLACTHVPDGTGVAVTSGHGRRTVVWDLATGRIRNVLAGHRGWSACVTCAERPRRPPLALTGGLDNRVNVWDLGRGHRRNRFRIVPPWTFLIRPSAGRAHAVRAVTLDDGKILALVATSDGMVRILEPHRLPWGARRAGSVPADAVGSGLLSNGQAIIVTATNDGVVQIWKREAFNRRGDQSAPLCEINLEVLVSDIAVLDHDMVIIATPNGLTAILLDARLLDDSLEYKPFRQAAAAPAARLN
jgi:WD40 repeat protein